MTAADSAEMDLFRASDYLADERPRSYVLDTVPNPSGDLHTARRARVSRWSFLLRPGNAGSNTASEHIEATTLALAQLPRRLRRRVLIRADSGGGTHGFLNWLARPGRRLAYSVGFTITDDIQDAILAHPRRRVDPGL